MGSLSYGLKAKVINHRNLSLSTKISSKCKQMDEQSAEECLKFLNPILKIVGK